MAVTVSAGSTLSFGAPEVLFRGDYDHSQNLNWDVDPSGRFVMVRPDPGTFRQFRVMTSLSGQLPSGP